MKYVCFPFFVGVLVDRDGKKVTVCNDAKKEKSKQKASNIPYQANIV
jgi:hypothetical protein